MPTRGVLVSNGGPHAAGAWAEVSAAMIVDLIDIAPSADRKFSTQKRISEIKLIELLEDHHATVQASERSKLLTGDAQRFTEKLDPSEHLADAVAAVVGVFSGTEFAEHFQSSDAQAAVASILAGHMASIQDIERQWHADRNPSIPEGQAYKAAVRNALTAV